jgi:signal transduction histidine kinase
MISFFAFSGLFNFISSLFLGIFTYLKGRKQYPANPFVLYFLSVAFWSFGYFFWQISTNSNSALFWSRVLMVGAIFIPIFYFHFIINFLNLVEKYKKALYGGYVLSFLFLISDFTPFFVKTVEPALFFPFWPKPGILYGPFLMMFFGFVCFSWYLLIKSLRKIKETVKKQQIKYFLLGTGIGFAGGSTNYLLWYGIPVPPYGNISVIFGVLLVTFALLKYHLFEIRVILTEILVGVMGVILLVLPFLMESAQMRILTAGIFLLFLIFGYLLIRATHQEIRRREEIEKLYEELKVLDKAKSEFISMASHQLRTPLSAIKGYISMILEGSYGPISEKVKEKMKNVFQSNERLINIVNNLLNISKIELGKMEVEKEEVQIEDLIQSCSEELKIEAEKKGLKLYFQKSKKALPKISIDSLKMRQVILNLIDNAIRYTQSGEIEIKAEKKNSKILISVRDTGEGLTKEEKKRIFEGFTRGGAGFTYWIEGAGLGLYVAKKYVELHRGKIWAESKGKGRGSTFYIELPIL